MQSTRIGVDLAKSVFEVAVSERLARAAKILPWSHILFSNFKSWLRGTFHGVSQKHLPRYLQEFVYRTNRRWLEHDLFFYVLRRAAQADPFPWSRLTAEATA